MSGGDSATPLGKVRGLGSAHHGGGHWLEERYTSVVLVPLSLWLLFSLLMLPELSQSTVAAWLRGPLAGEARAVSSSGALARTGWFDSARLGALADAHIAGRSDHSRLIWQLLMLERSLARLGVG